MVAYWYRFRQLLGFYRRAVTKYQIHSPFVFGLVNEVLHDDRWYYAFRDIEQLRRQMLQSGVILEVRDFGAGAAGAENTEAGVLRKVSLKSLAGNVASSPVQGRMLFRIANFLGPKTMLELGTSAGIGALYLASAVRSAKVITLEACPECARVARTHFDLMGLKNVEIMTGTFKETLPRALAQLQHLDFVFVDGNHRPEPTLEYFETCLPCSTDKAVFVFDDVYWSPGMEKAWRQIQNHPRVTLTIDFFDLSLAFINPDFREKQHFRVVSSALKPWKVF